MRILVADECADTRASFARLLALLGHEVRTACGGPDAVAAAVGHHPHVAFLDLSAPGSDAYETAARLHYLLPDTTLVAVTNGQREQPPPSSAVFECSLPKPVRVDAVIELLDAQGSRVPGGAAGHKSPLRHERP